MFASFRIQRRVVRSNLLHAGFLLGWYSTHKMEVISSSETSVNIRTTRHYIQEDGNIHNYSCENLKSFSQYSRYPILVSKQAPSELKSKALSHGWLVNLIEQSNYNYHFHPTRAPGLDLSPSDSICVWRGWLYQFQETLFGYNWAHCRLETYCTVE
jgi:hypothetical protein